MTRPRNRLVVAGLAAGVLALAGFAGQPRYYDGPVSGHFDGTRFFFPDRPFDKGLPDVLWWQLTSERAAWPDSMPATSFARPAERVEGDSMTVTWIGHATLLIQTAGLNILTDPTWAERASLVSFAGPKRVSPPGVRFADLPPVDVVLVSHSHFDHMDLPTLARLAREHDPLVITPLGNDAILLDHAPAMRVVTLDWWQSRRVSDGVAIHAVPVQHWSRRTLLDRNRALWAGFVIEGPGGNIYFAGDTGFGDGAFFGRAAERFGGFRLALLPLGAYEPRWFMAYQHINPEEALLAHRLLNAQTSIGMHFGTFQLSDEAIDQPLIDLDAARRRHDIPKSEFTTLPVGGVWSATASPGGRA